MKKFTFADYQNILQELEKQAHPTEPVEVAGKAYELGYKRALERANRRAKREKEEAKL